MTFGYPVSFVSIHLEQSFSFVFHGINNFEGYRLVGGPSVWVCLIVSFFHLFLPQLAPSHLSAVTVNVTSSQRPSQTLP